MDVKKPGYTVAISGNGAVPDVQAARSIDTNDPPYQVGF